MMRRPIIAFLTACAFITGVASDASAGTYAIRSCGDAAGALNHSWTAHNNDEGPGQIETGDGCAFGDAYGGLYARDALTCSDVCPFPPSGSVAGWTFTAPAGTTITALSYSRWLYKMDDDNWQPALIADGAVVDGETCSIGYPDYECSIGDPNGARTVRTFGAARTLDIAVRCAADASTGCVDGSSLHRVAAVLYGATVTLSDPSAPVVSNVDGPLFGGGYLTRSSLASFDATDNAGVASSRLYVDGVAQTSTTYSCDDTYAVPCSGRAGSELVLDTRSLTDGSHEVQVAATDPAGNEAKSSARTITVDNTAPNSPLNLAADGGGSWHPSNSFSVSWTNPGGQVAPVTSVRYSVCNLDGSSCSPPQQSQSLDVSHIGGIAVPTQGEWLLKVWLQDAAGNVDSTRAATTTLRYGSAPTTTTTQASSDAGSQSALPGPPPSEPSLATAPFIQPPVLAATLQDPALRLTSARYLHGRLVLRGRIARSAAGILLIRVRAGSRALSLSRRVTGGPFRLSLRLRRPTTKISVRFRGTAFFRAASATARVR